MLLAPRYHSGTWVGILGEPISLLLTVLAIGSMVLLGLFRCYLNFNQSLLSQQRCKDILQSLPTVGYLSAAMFIIMVSLDTFKRSDPQTVTITEGRLVFSEGEVSYITPLLLDWYLLKKDTEVTKAEVSGPGGSTIAAYYMRYRLQSSGISETVAYGEKCASSCTILWTGGANRTIQSPIYLAFHQTCGMFSCQPFPHLYDGFLTEELMEVIASPGPEHACPIGAKEVAILEGEELDDKKSLTRKVVHVCRNRGLSLKNFNRFPGYDNISDPTQTP